MYWNLWLKTFINNVKININEYTSTALLTDSFLVDRVNKWLKQILSYRQRYWNVVQDEILWDWITSLATYDLTYYPKNIQFIWDTVDNTYREWARVTWMFTNLISNSEVRQYKNSWLTLTLSEAVNQIHVQYEKWFNQLTITDYNDDAELPIPHTFNDILENLVLSMINPIWLWEWVWDLLATFRSTAYTELEKMAKVDSYDEPPSEVKSYRYWYNGKV